jgi:hypothetical protein
LLDIKSSRFTLGHPSSEEFRGRLLDFVKSNQGQFSIFLAEMEAIPRILSILQNPLEEI